MFVFKGLLTFLSERKIVDEAVLIEFIALTENENNTESRSKNDNMFFLICICNQQIYIIILIIKVLLAFILHFLTFFVLHFGMQQIKITFLGTGTSQGVPIIACNCEVCTSLNPFDNRLRSSILIEDDVTKVVIDSGPDFRQQLLREKVKMLNAVVFTHEHKDHIAGLDEVKAFNYLYKMRMPVFVTKRVEEALHREFAYIFAEEKYPGIPEIDVVNFDNDTFNIGNIKFEPINVLHYKLPVKGFKINNFAYVTDANFISEEEKLKLKNLDVLVLNALRLEPHLSHFTLNQALDLINELKPKKAYLTHISHQLGLHTAISDLLPGNVELAVDGLQIII